MCSQAAQTQKSWCRHLFHLFQVFSSLAEIFSAATSFCQSESVSIWSEQEVLTERPKKESVAQYIHLVEAPLLQSCSSIWPSVLFPHALLWLGERCFHFSGGVMHVLNMQTDELPPEANPATVYNGRKAENGLGSTLSNEITTKKKECIFKKYVIDFISLH